MKKIFFPKTLSVQLYPLWIAVIFSHSFSIYPQKIYCIFICIYDFSIISIDIAITSDHVLGATPKAV